MPDGRRITFQDLNENRTQGIRKQSLPLMPRFPGHCDGSSNTVWRKIRISPGSLSLRWKFCPVWFLPKAFPESSRCNIQVAKTDPQCLLNRGWECLYRSNQLPSLAVTIFCSTTICVLHGPADSRNRRRGNRSESQVHPHHPLYSARF